MELLLSPKKTERFTIAREFTFQYGATTMNEETSKT